MNFVGMADAPGTSHTPHAGSPLDRATPEDTGERTHPASKRGRTGRNRFNPRRLFLWCAGTLVLYLAWQTFSINRYGFRDDGQSADCAIVLGGAAWHDKPSPVLRERLNHAIRLFQEGRVEALVLTGGKGTGAAYSEGEVAHDYCLERGIPEQALFVEGRSKTTLENLQEAKKILQAQKFRDALIVSDPWHLKRGVLIARRQDIEASPSATTTSRFESFKSRSGFTMRELYLYHLYLFFNR